MPVEGHAIYAPRGRRLYSVTEVLGCYFQEFMEKSRVASFIIEHAAAKGTLVHQWCVAYAMGLFVPDLPGEYQGYCRSFAAWFDTYVDKVIFMEERLHDYDLGFYGHPDLLCRVRHHDFDSLFDLKTPIAHSVLWGLQLSAYYHLLKKNGYNPAWAGSLQLDPDGGSPRVTKHVYAERDLAVFLSGLTIRRYVDAA